METADEKEYLVSLIQRIRNALWAGLSREEIHVLLIKGGYKTEEIYLAYSAAKLMQKY